MKIHEYQGKEILRNFYPRWYRSTPQPSPDASPAQTGAAVSPAT